MQALNAINKELEKIGHQKPDMREASALLRNYYIDVFDKEFDSHGSDLGPLTNSVRDTISPNIITKFGDLVPSFDVLASELKNGRRREFQGAESWDALAKKYIGIIINKVKELAIHYVTNYIDVIKKRICIIMSDDYKPCNSSAKGYCNLYG